MTSLVSAIGSVGDEQLAVPDAHRRGRRWRRQDVALQAATAGVVLGDPPLDVGGPWDDDGSPALST
jgi:hypothetical protein